MTIFDHHIYEYKKGIRGLVLYTFSQDELKYIESRLKANKIDYYCLMINNEKGNVFFGNKRCVEVVRCFSNKNLSLISREEDFILGAMLGYSIEKQCQRFLAGRRKKGIVKEEKSENFINSALLLVS